MTCPSGKRIYRTRKKAVRALDYLRTLANNRGQEWRTEQSVYQCPDCEWWHLTSLPAEPREPRPKPVQPLPPVGRIAPPAPAQPWEVRPARKRAA